MIRLIFLVLVLLPCAALATPDNPGRYAREAPRWECTVASQFMCAESSCKSMPKSVRIKIDFPGNRFAYCSSGKCAWQPMRVVFGNPWIELSSGNAATYLKMWGDGSQFVEVNGAPPSVIVGFGTCTPDRP